MRGARTRVAMAIYGRAQLRAYGSDNLFRLVSCKHELAGVARRGPYTQRNCACGVWTCYLLFAIDETDSRLSAAHFSSNQSETLEILPLAHKKHSLKVSSCYLEKCAADSCYRSQK